MSKKGAKVPKEPPSYELRDIVLAKVRGFPPWPGMVVDPNEVPPTVTRERPSSKKTQFYCVRFFPAGDFAWLVAKDISKLQKHEILAYINEPFKRSGDLLAGYQIALDPAKWEEERRLSSQAAAEEEANAEVDQLESENEQDEDGKKDKSAKSASATAGGASSKKRKRESDAPPPKAKAKPAAAKAKKEPVEGKKANGRKAKSRAMVESEDDADHAGQMEDEDAGPSKKSSPPPAKKTKRDKEGDDELDAAMSNDPEALKVRDWRHRLQKAFLSNKGLPKDEDMPGVDKLFTSVESYDKINIQYLSFSKIGKVMRHIAVLPADKVPRDKEFKFKERAQALVDKWHQILNSNKTNGSTSDGGANGVKTAPPAEGALPLAGANGAADEGDAMQVDAPGEADPAVLKPEDGAGEGDLSVLADLSTMSEA